MLGGNRCTTQPLDDKLAVVIGVMDEPHTPNDPETDETPKQRVDRELAELLQGLRVALPGVQVLFAFLLTVPFAAGFAAVDDFGRRVYFVSLVTAAAASICFIAPAAQHRMLFRTGSKELLLQRSNMYGIAGAALLGISTASATFLVVRYLFESTAAALTAAFVVLLSIWAWFGQPLIARMSSQ